MALATRNRRLSAYAADAILLTALLYMLAMLLAALSGPSVDLPQTGHGLIVHRGRLFVSALTSAAASIFYFSISWAAVGATPGQLMHGIRVVRADGQGRLGPAAAAARAILFWGPAAMSGVLGTAFPVLTLPLGLTTFLWLVTLFVTTTRSRTRQGLHDRAAASVVIQAAPAAAARHVAESHVPAAQELKTV